MAQGGAPLSRQLPGPCLFLPAAPSSEELTLAPGAPAPSCREVSVSAERRQSHWVTRLTNVPRGCSLPCSAGWEALCLRAGYHGLCSGGAAGRLPCGGQCPACGISSDRAPPPVATECGRRQQQLLQEPPTCVGKRVVVWAWACVCLTPALPLMGPQRLPSAPGWAPRRHPKPDLGGGQGGRASPGVGG